MTQSLEDYLETIGILMEKNSKPRVTDIAAMLGLSKASVHIALHALEEKGMVVHEHYGTISLTDAGFIEYRKIKHRHDTLKDYLKLILEVSDENAERDACLMEHILSEETFSKIERIINEHKA